MEQVKDKLKEMRLKKQLIILSNIKCYSLRTAGQDPDNIQRKTYIHQSCSW
jgi:hypothetical protein